MATGKKKTSEDSIPNSLKNNSEDPTSSSRKRRSEEPDISNLKRKSEEFVIKGKSEEGLSMSSEKKSRGDSLVSDI